MKQVWHINWDIGKSYGYCTHHSFDPNFCYQQREPLQNCPGKVEECNCLGLIAVDGAIINNGREKILGSLV